MRMIGDRLCSSGVSPDSNCLDANTIHFSLLYYDGSEHTVKDPLQADGDELDDVLDCEGHDGESPEYYLPAYSRLLWH